MKYKIEFEVECSVATTKQLKDFFNDLFIDVDNDIVTYPSKIKITKLNTQ